MKATLALSVAGDQTEDWITSSIGGIRGICMSKRYTMEDAHERSDMDMQDTTFLALRILKYPWKQLRWV